MRMPWLIGILIAAVALAAFFAWRTWFETYHLVTVKDGVLYRDGVRTEREFENTVRRVKPKSIVRLIDSEEAQKEPFVSEAAYCKANNIEIIPIPIKLGGWPSSEQVRQFVAIVQDPTKQPVLVHCAQGVRRTGMMVAAYERAVMGKDVKEIADTMPTFGHSQRTVKDVQKFIDVYDPKTGAVPEAMPVGQE